MRRPRVLLVEDDPSVLKMTQLRLEHEGFDVTELPIHLVLLDVKLPKLNGYEVCRTLKHQPQTSHIPMELMSKIRHALGEQEGSNE